MAFPQLDYAGIWAETVGMSRLDALAYFEAQLPWLCRDAYVAASGRPDVIVQVPQGSFVYVFDAYTTLEATGEVPYSDTAESRLVVAYGRSAPSDRARKGEDKRLRGWVGPTNATFGKGWDKGHFMAHSIGGAVDGVEANVFVQRRDLNRGWSPEGKRFREMETYCVEHPGTPCFVRPIYGDGTARPRWFDYGLIKEDGTLDVEMFKNHYDE